MYLECVRALILQLQFRSRCVRAGIADALRSCLRVAAVPRGCHVTTQSTSGEGGFVESPHRFCEI
jgi:hypothetical protein